MKGFIKQSVVYSIGIAMTRLVSLFMLPLYTRFLTPADYGILDILLTIGSLSLPFFLLGVNSSFQILYFSPSSETKEQRNDLFITSIVIIICSATLFTLIGILLSPVLVNFFLQNKTFIPVTYMIFVNTWVFSLFNLFHSNLRIRANATLFNIVTLCQVVFTAGFNIFFVAIQHQGVEGVISGTLVANILATTLAAILVFRYHYLQLPTFKYARPLLSLGFPLIPTLVLGWVINASDRFFLAKISTLQEVGTYGVANRLATAIGLFVYAVQLGWRPFALSIQTRPDARKLYAAIPIYYFVVVGWFGLLIVTLSPLLLQIFATQAYKEAIALMTPLVFSQMMYGVVFILSTGLEIEQRVSYITFTTLLAAIVNTILNIVLIPQLEAFGAALATAVAYSISALFVGIVSQRFYPLPYNIRRLSSVLLSLLVLYSIMYCLFQCPDTTHKLILNSFFIFVSSLILLNFVRSEARMLIGWLLNLLRQEIVKAV